MVYCLSRSLYDLKQSPHAWFGNFQIVTQQFGIQSDVHYSLFYRHSP